MNDIINNTKNNQCSNCGQCCTEFLPLNQEEIDTIKQYIKKHNIKPSPIYENGKIYVFCPFRDRENKKCKIYSIRPRICKTFICSKYYSRIIKERNEIIKSSIINSNPFNIISLNKLFYNISTLDNLYEKGVL